jgi:general secretion pathway protein C
MIRYGFTVLNILLVTVASFFCVDLFYQVVSAKLALAYLSDLKAISAPPSGFSKGGDFEPPRQILEKTAYQPIVDRDLFKTQGSKKPEKTLDQIALESLEETRLSLTLWGTVTGIPDRPYAVIEEKKTRKQGLYREGDAIENAQIKMILRKKVVLTVNGKDEILLMEEKKGATANFPSRSDEEPYAPMAAEDDTVSVDRETVDSALKDINQLMRQVRVRPHFKDGRPEGLLLSHIRPNSIFQEMGLQSGDIVKGVNGNEIKSVDDALKFYESLKSSSSVQLQIERQGEEKRIDYRID